MRKTPAVIYSGGYTIGQVADRWNRSPEFVRSMIAQGKLDQDDRNLISNTSLRSFYAEHGTGLDV